MSQMPMGIRLPDGKILRAAVARIQSRYEDGMPEDITLLRDDMVIELSEDVSKNHFITVYVDEKHINKSKQSDRSTE